MLPSETMIWQPEFTDKTLSRKPGAVQLCQGGIILSQLFNTTLVITALFVQDIQLATDFLILLLHLRCRHLHLCGGMLTHLVIKGRIHHTGHIRHGFLFSHGLTVTGHVHIRQIQCTTNRGGCTDNHNPQPQVLLAFHNGIDTGHQLPSPSRITYTSMRAPASNWLAGWLNITARVPGCQKSLSRIFRADSVLFSTEKRTIFR
ncbi:tail protein from Bacteriophage (fragment) [Escherichia coli]